MIQLLYTSWEERNDSMKAQYWLVIHRGFKEIKYNFWTKFLDKNIGFQVLIMYLHMLLYQPTGLMTGRNINVKELSMSLNDSNDIKKHSSNTSCSKASA